MTLNTSSSPALVLILIAPFLGGLAALLLPTTLRKLFIIVNIAILLTSIGSLSHDLEKTIRYEISGWAAPLGINFIVDGLSVSMLVLTASISATVALFAYGYYRDPKYSETARGFWPLFFFLWGSLNTIFLVSDLFTMYVCLELTTFASVALIAIAKNPDALKAALSYLMAALMGSLAYLLGVALIYAQTGTLDWLLIASRFESGAVTWIALSLMTSGLIIKSALFPLHFWLPDAHAIAPAPVSALLSALVVKAPFFVLLRIWIQMLPEVPFASHVLGSLGAGAIIWGSFQAIIQERVKLMVAYSTVAQLGYLFLIFPILSAASTHTDTMAKRDAWEGAIYFTISHGVAKAAMFLVAGIVLQATKTDYLKDMQGAAAKVPLAILVWGLAGISLIGLPPSGGFIAKWQILTAAIRFGLWPYSAVILFGGLLASGYIFRVLWHAFLKGDESQATADVPYSMLVATMILGVIIVVLGIRTADVLSLLKVGSPFFNGGTP